jgi:uroporphyrin-III C-methyltransferase
MLAPHVVLLEWWSVDRVLQALVYACLLAVGALLERSGWWLRLSSVVSRRWRRAGGRVRLVGAGPGDPALLTVAARRALHEADVVIADLLVPEETLALVCGRLVMSNKLKGCANKAQRELQDWTLDALSRGLDVVRLKGGDPFVYGRGAEEIDDFRRHGYEVEVVPGISSALAAPLAAGIAVTTRGVADQIAVSTGHGKDDSVPLELVPYAPGRTAIYLMSVGRMDQLMQRLHNAGYPAATPVAVVESAATRNQRVIRGRLLDIARVCQQHAVKSPATIVVGRATEALLHPAHPGEVSHYQWGLGSVCFRAAPTAQPGTA